MSRALWLISLLALPLAPGLVRAQESGGDVTQRGPRFLLAARTARPVPVDVSRTPVLHQRISVQLEDVTLEEALAVVSRKAGLHLLYSTAVVPLDRRVRLLADDISVAGALTELLFGSGVDVLFSSGNQAALVRRPVEPQPGSIAGTVWAVATGAPLPRVTVTVVGTRLATETDADGRYAILDVPPGTHPLRARLLGYAPADTSVVVEEGRQTVVDFRLRATALELSAIVVTALGVEKQQRSLGYAVQEVPGTALQEAREPNLVSSLTGQVAGLVVYNKTGLYETPEFSLRGAQPLIVIDGVPTSTDLWDKSPSDIENITVLKGTAASALYGSRGKDGAILIETKGSREAREALSITYSSSTMFQTGFTAIPEVQTQYGAGRSGRYAFVDGKGGGEFDGDGWIWGPRLDQRDPVTGECMKVPQYDSPMDPATGQRVPTCWVSRGANNFENFLRTGVITDHNLSATHQTEKGFIRASLSHMYQRGQVPNTKLNRTGFLLSGGYDFSAKFKADASWNFSRQYSPNYERRDYGPHNYIYDLLLWMGPDVDVNDLKEYWQKGEEGIQQRHYNYAWYNNPYFLAYENLQGYYKDVNYGRFSLDYRFSDNLKLTTLTGVNVYSLRTELQTPKSMIDYSAPVDGRFSVSNATELDLNSRALLQYERRVHPDWGVRASFGGEARWYENKWLSSSTTGLHVPELYNLSNSIGPIQASNYLGQKRTNSLFGTLDVSFRNAIFLGFTGRNDWSSALPLENNSYFYPSVSLSTVVSELVPVPKFVSYLQLRGSWAQVSADLGIYSTVPVYQPAVNWNGNPSVSFPGRQLNPDIRPETSTASELGVGIGFLDERLGLDVTHYDIVDKNDITDFPVSLASGYGSRLLNANKYNRKGWEVALRGTPIRMDNSFSWDLTLNWSRHRQYLRELPEGVQELEGVKVGERMDLLRGWRFLRSPDGRIIYENGLPRWEPTQGKLGYTDPDWVAGLSSSLRYKDFALDFRLDGRYGGDLWSQTHRKMWWGGTHPGSVAPWRKDENSGNATYVGDGVVVVSGEVERDAAGSIIRDTRVFAPNTTPVFWSEWLNAYYHSIDEAVTFDATFLKLREVALTYQLPQRWLRLLSAKRGSISLVGRNLWLWTKDLEFVDPDTGEDDLQNPSARTVGFNINLTF